MIIVEWACDNCGVGKFSESTRANGSHFCTKCAFNADSPHGSGQNTDCKCESGFTGADGATRANGGQCTPCSAGTYKVNAGSAICDLCIANANSVGQSSSRSLCRCNVGYFSNASMTWTWTMDGFLGEYNVFSNPEDMEQIFPTYEDYYRTSPLFVFASSINFDIEEKFPWKGARTTNQFIAQ